MIIRQRRAWRFYADRRKLRFHSSGLMSTPTLNGTIEEYTVSIFASEHSELDERSQRRLTAIELTMNSCLPVHAAFASGGMVEIVERLNIAKEFKPNVKGWDDSYIIRTRDIAVTQGYLTEDRLNQVVGLMRMDKAWVVIMFVQEQGLIRIDTPLPLDSPKKIDLVIKQMINAARVLELKDGEVKDLMRRRLDEEASRKTLDIDDDLLDDHLGLELEDDEG